MTRDEMLSDILEKVRMLGWTIAVSEEWAEGEFGFCAGPREYVCGMLDDGATVDHDVYEADGNGSEVLQ